MVCIFTVVPKVCNLVLSFYFVVFSQGTANFESAGLIVLIETDTAVHLSTGSKFIIT